MNLPLRHDTEQPHTGCGDLTDRLIALHADFSATAGRLSTVVAELDTVTAAPIMVADNGMVDACRALDRMAELRALVRLAAGLADAGLVAHVDTVVSVAAELAAVLRGHEPAHHAMSGPVDRCRRGLGASLAGRLAAETGLGPNETVPSLILAVEILSLAGRVVLVLARLARSGSRAPRLAGALAGPVLWWTARVVSMVVSVDLWHHPALAGLATAVTVVGRFAAPRSARTRADVLGVLASATLPHAVVVAHGLPDARRFYQFGPDQGDEIAANNTETWNENTENREVVVMSYSPGDWIELVRSVEGGSAGQRGKVTSTSFLGGLDIELANGTRLTGVDASAVKTAPPSPNSGDGGCAVVGVVATVAAAAVAGWTRARWGA